MAQLWAERCNPIGIGSRLGCRMSKLQRHIGDLPYAREQRGANLLLLLWPCTESKTP